MKKYQIIDDNTLERLFKELSVNKKLKDKEEEDIQFQYIELVYPPGSNPPIKNSIKKMTLIGLNQISLQTNF